MAYLSSIKYKYYLKTDSIFVLTVHVTSRRFFLESDSDLGPSRGTSAEMSFGHGIHLIKDGTRIAARWNSGNVAGSFVNLRELEEYKDCKYV